MHISYITMINEINTDARLTTTAKVYQQGNGLGTLIPMKIIQNLGIEKYDLVEVTIRHTGIRNGLTKKSNFPNAKN